MELGVLKIPGEIFGGVWIGVRECLEMEFLGIIEGNG